MPEILAAFFWIGVGGINIAFFVGFLIWRQNQISESKQRVKAAEADFLAGIQELQNGN